MQIRFSVVALSILTAGLAFSPAALAVVGGSLHSAEPCLAATDDGTADVFAPPGGFTLGWKSSCTTVANGGSIVWENLDAIPHFVRAAGCFTLDRMTQQVTTSVSLSYDADRGLLTANGEECLDYRESDAGLEIAYDCGIHGALMPGKIVIEL